MTSLNRNPSKEALKSKRKPENPDDRVLSDEARAVFGSLPERLFPAELMRRYPRSANRLAAHWRRPTAIMREFSDLLIDHRGDRQGFPVAVALEIYALHDYYITEVSPRTISIWEDSDRTRYRA